MRDECLRNYCNDNDVNLLEIDGRAYHGKKLKSYLSNKFLSEINKFVKDNNE
jgi:hypothetical protein